MIGGVEELLLGDGRQVVLLELCVRAAGQRAHGLDQRLDPVRHLFVQALHLLRSQVYRCWRRTSIYKYMKFMSGGEKYCKRRIWGKSSKKTALGHARHPVSKHTEGIWTIKIKLSG
jgi:hypothetical protein